MIQTPLQQNKISESDAASIPKPLCCVADNIQIFSAKLMKGLVNQVKQRSSEGQIITY